MNVERMVADRIAADSAVQALVSTRVYQLKLPQRPTLPAIRVQLIDEPETYHLRGEDSVTRARVQVDAYVWEVGVTDPYASVEAVADAARDALVGEPFTTGGRTGSAFRETRSVIYEGEELRLIRVTQDFTVWSKATN